MPAGPTTVTTFSEGQADSTQRPVAFVVEPDPLTCWSVRSFLERWYDVRTARTAGETDLLLEESGPSLLVIAESLPDGSSAPIIRRVLERDRRVRVIETVVPPSSGGREAADPGGAVTVVEKPFLLDALASVLQLPH